MTIRLLTGDCRATLATLESESVQSCITSPPYLGLRDYGTPPLVWGGDAGEREQCGHPCKEYFALGSCDCTINGGAKHVHEWLRVDEFHNRGDDSAGAKQKSNNGAVTGRGVVRYGTCACGAWLGSLGLEPTPEMYIEHVVECFRAVRRVLRGDGVLWLNIGDSYAGSGKGPTGWNGMQNAERRQGFAGGPDLRAKRSERPREGLKPKDLQMMPARVAVALQQDGWWLRSMIPWLKRNAMPESVTDRPATSVEYVFLLSKSRTYFFDGDAVRMKVGEPTRRNAEFRGVSVYKDHIADGIGNSAARPEGKSSPGPKSMEGRNRRNGDWFFESWQGLMLDEQDDPLALVVNPQPFKGSHFATFPPKLVEPMVKASTRPGDTILDPFGGAGTVGLVADRLGRSAVLCELSDQYSPMATDRLIGDSPMFTEVEVA